MKAEEFMRAISNADFELLIGDRLGEFSEFVEKRESEGRNRVVLRFLMQRVDGEEIYAPYYMWAIYPMHIEDGVLEIFPPDFEDASTFLRVPDEVKEEPYFEVVI